MSAALATLQPRDVDELAAMVRDASGGLRVRGAGTWMDAQAASRAITELHLDAFRGVRAYTPDDLTISVGAATTLAELNAATREHGQWCPLLPWGDDRGSVGATVATATAGPFAESLGRPRDLVLGLECVDGLGRLLRPGGRVVKNVAGFDLTRLMTGSWGTLGVITELHLRLRARPAVDATIYVEAGSADSMQRFLRSAHAPLAAMQPSAAAAQALGRSNANVWLLRLGGNAPSVAAAKHELERLGKCTELPADVWDTVRHEMAPAPAVARWPWTPLQQRVKQLFDPRDVLNPGVLGDRT